MRLDREKIVSRLQILQRNLRLYRIACRAAGRCGCSAELLLLPEHDIVRLAPNSGRHGHLAKRVLKEAGNDSQAQVKTIYRIAFSREPSPAELRNNPWKVPQWGPLFMPVRPPGTIATPPTK